MTKEKKRIQTQGLLKFEIGKNGNIVYNNSNVEKLRKLFLDRKLINGEKLGPGDPGDFDLGAWHILCHLVAGCAVFRNAESYIWIEISHVPLIDLYTSTATVETDSETVNTFPILSAEGRLLLEKAELLGFVEGSSLGHISARGIKDPIDKFNNCTRQEYDMNVDSDKEGGRVWEHWCTIRDISANSDIGTSVLKAYLSMISLCGGRFVSIIARGRREYCHPEQLVALVKYGLISSEEAIVDITPKPIPENIEQKIYTADPQICIKAIKNIAWVRNDLSYYMFKRRINKWSTTNEVKNDLLGAKLI